MARKYTAQVQPINLEFLTNQMNALQKAYDEQQEAISALALEASAVGSMIGPADGKVWDDYQRYMQGIQDETDRFNATGLNPTSRQAIFNLRNQYATEVLPIKSAITRRQQAIDDFNKSPEGKSPLYIGNRPSDTSVDEWMNGATPQIDGIDGNSLLSYVSQEVKNASDRHYRYYTDNGYLIKKIGTSQAETAQLMDALRGNYSFDGSTAQGAYMNDVLNDIRQSVIKNAGMVFGLNRFAGTPYERQIDSIIEGGIYTGMAGKEERSVDQWAMHEDDKAFQKWKMNQEHIWKIQEGGNNSNNKNSKNNTPESPVIYGGSSVPQEFVGNNGNRGVFINRLIDFQRGAQGPINITVSGDTKVTNPVTGEQVVIRGDNDPEYYSFDDPLDVKRIQEQLEQQVQIAKREVLHDSKWVSGPSPLEYQKLTDEQKKRDAEERQRHLDELKYAEGKLNRFNNDPTIKYILDNVITDDAWSNYKDMVKEYNRGVTKDSEKLDINDISTRQLLDIADNIENYQSLRYYSPSIDKSTASQQFEILQQQLYNSNVSQVDVLNLGSTRKQTTTNLETFKNDIGINGDNITSIQLDPILLMEGKVRVCVGIKRGNSTVENKEYSVPYKALGPTVSGKIDKAIYELNEQGFLSGGSRSNFNVYNQLVEDLAPLLRSTLEKMITSGSSQSTSNSK